MVSEREEANTRGKEATGGEREHRKEKNKGKVKRRKGIGVRAIR